MSQIEILIARLDAIRGRDAISRARRASIRNRIRELEAQLPEAGCRK